MFLLNFYKFTSYTYKESLHKLLVCNLFYGAFVELFQIYKPGAIENAHGN